ncbi:MAG TPA: divergent polysaccharide deacetylase family protein [bacterium]
MPLHRSPSGIPAPRLRVLLLAAAAALSQVLAVPPLASWSWLPGPPAARAGAPPRVAIVFEHAGASLADLAPIYAMHQPFGLGIFPHKRYSAQIVRDAMAHGLVPILHLPMEARNPADTAPVAGAVWVRMTDPQITRIVEDDLASTPGVVGVSNHAGSRATADPRIMTAVLRTVKARGLWFEENRTTPVSVASNVAAHLGVRRVLITTYLDDPPVDIERKVRALIPLAQRRGSVLAAAHITTGTPQVVLRLLPEFRRAGIVFVPITEFLTP